MKLSGLGLLFLSCALKLAATVEGVFDDSTCKQISENSATARLKAALTCLYDSALIPTTDKNRKVPRISLSMFLRQMEYDDWRGTIQLSHWMVMQWTDQHLTWTPSKYENIMTMKIPSEILWVPDITIYNPSEMSSSLVSKPSEVNCLVTHAGVVSCVIPGTYSGQCLSDYKAFPYDTHKCTLKFGTLLNTVDDLLFTNFTVDTVHLYENNQWLLHKTNSGIRNKLRRKLSDDGNAVVNASRSFQEMFCEVTFQRHSAMLESTMVIPMLVLMLFALIPLFLDPTQMERFFLLIINIGCHFNVFFYLPWFIPPSGYSAPILVLFYRDSLLILCSLLIQSWLANWMEENKNEPPGWIMAINTLITRQKDSALGLLSSQSAAPTGDEANANGIIETKLETNPTEDHLMEGDENSATGNVGNQPSVNNWQQFRKYVDIFSISLAVLIYVGLFFTHIPIFYSIP